MLIYTLVDTYFCTTTSATLNDVFAILQVIAAITKVKKLRNPGNMFIINLTASDIIISVFVDPMALVGECISYRIDR